MCRPVYDYRMWLDLEDRGISRTLVLFGEREIEHKRMLEMILKPGVRIFDIGANIGYYAIMESKKIGEDGHILAIEPSPSNVKLLKRNLELNAVTHITVREGAVSDTVGTKQFHLAHQSNLNTFHNSGSGVEHLNGESIDVQTYALPQLVDEYGAPDLIRMDVEGHEVAILRGLVETLKAGTAKPQVIFETHLSRYHGDNAFAPVLRELFDLGYTVPLAASSWEAGSKIVDSKGYKAIETVKSDAVSRNIYKDISCEDAISLICHEGGLRTVLLAPSAL